MEDDELNTVYFNCDAQNPVTALKEFLRERLQPGVDSQEEDYGEEEEVEEEEKKREEEEEEEEEDYGEVGYYSVVREEAERGLHTYYFIK